jgi:hypothetical protein
MAKFDFPVVAETGIRNDIMNQVNQLILYVSRTIPFRSDLDRHLIRAAMVFTFFAFSIQKWSQLYHSGDLTILNVIWAPRMTIMPHNHQMWAQHLLAPGARRPWRQAGSRRRKGPIRERC